MGFFRTAVVFARILWKIVRHVIYISLGFDVEASPFLTENFAPVDKELDKSDLEIVGELPADLDGMYVRNGPNPKFKPAGRYHWFDGDGMLHGVHISDGKASYVNRWTRTARLEAAEKAGRAVGVTIGDILGPYPMGHIVKEAIMSRIRGPTRPGGGSANTSVEYHAGRFLALVESSNPTQVQLPQLATVGLHNFDGKLSETDSFTAHPKVDPVTGEMLFFGYGLRRQPYLKYHVVDKDGQLVRLMDVKLPIPAMLHDFAVTEHHVIIPYFPMFFRQEAFIFSKPMFEFGHDRPSKYGIMHRTATSEEEITWFKGPACYMFHSANAWDDGDEVVMVGMRAPCVGLMPCSKSPSGCPSYGARLYMWRFNLTSGEMTEKALNEDLFAEFPTINPNYRGRKNRFVYAGAFEQGPNMDVNLLQIGSAVKFDLQENTVQEVSFGPGRFGGEPFFVPRVGAKDEDDGHLVTYVYDSSTDKSEFVVLDAKHMRPEPLARVLLPQRVPYGFHGRWVTRDEINQQRLD
eukprot:TRINITY_DN7438_c1_g1_i1.p1 TRINITY_DN7438_c1_g1~~TRINITY_DN7438_c1_g1_i1.p1  ORF type:complete len:519 (-),score=158.11 TRINITY_DN7438_c1_g1_i1:328-1884(-)